MNLKLNKKNCGAIAEQQACHYLQQKGLKKLESNYYCLHGEIDLIMQDKDDIVFVEVRSRSGTTYGTALESITHAKRNKLIKTALKFLQVQNLLHLTCRFDVVGIQNVNGKIEFHWIQNAFQMTGD